MGYTVKDPQGNPVAGDGVVDQEMRDFADSIGGTIVDQDTGVVVYPEAS
ncbi:hypothetical protein SEA_RIKSENGUPTA_48 [Microbacterium phage RikSengupta]|nr:hypothetical protein SEA_TINYMINY_48 [Microbacterium phage TinyMiny]WMI33144.1 hypothetical protein SEA_RIKSENGUPTA_48 [Microbacterium phage RikSengupta]